MANCRSQKFVGRDCVLEYHIGCGDELPSAGDWKRLGALRTKELTIEWDTADATADDSVGALRENLATFQSLSVSGDGTLKASGVGAPALIALTKHVISPTATAGQPVAWIRLTFPDLTFTFFSIVTNMSRSAPYDDLATYSFEAMATTSDFGLLVDDTIDPSAPAVTTVTVAPSTVSIAVGASTQLTKTIAPVGAHEGVTWTSATPAVATVDQTGKVTGLTTGTSVITATSKADPLKKGTSTVTVTA